MPRSRGRRGGPGAAAAGKRPGGASAEAIALHSASDSDEDVTCPLCCEEMDISDRNFVPCACGYQVCLFCYHDLRDNLDGKCPNCRTPYSDDNVVFKAVDREQVVREKRQKEVREKAERRKEKERERQRERERERAAATAGSAGVGGGGAGVGSAGVGGVGPRGLASDGGSSGHGGPMRGRDAIAGRRELANIRVIQRNLVYVTGLSPELAREDTLRRHEYFGQYGTIIKVVVNRAFLPASDGRLPCAAAYVTYQDQEDARTCISSIDGHWLDNRCIRASFGTTKYCNAFLRGVQCNNQDCLYLHEMGGHDDSFTKDEMQPGRAGAAFHDKTHVDAKAAAEAALKEEAAAAAGAPGAGTGTAGAGSAAATTNGGGERPSGWASAAAAGVGRPASGSDVGAPPGPAPSSGSATPAAAATPSAPADDANPKTGGKTMAWSAAVLGGVTGGAVNKSEDFPSLEGGPAPASSGTASPAGAAAVPVSSNAAQRAAAAPTRQANDSDSGTATGHGSAATDSSDTNGRGAVPPAPAPLVGPPPGWDAGASDSAPLAGTGGGGPAQSRFMSSADLAGESDGVDMGVAIGSGPSLSTAPTLPSLGGLSLSGFDSGPSGGGALGGSGPGSSAAASGVSGGGLAGTGPGSDFVSALPGFGSNAAAGISTTGGSQDLGRADTHREGGGHGTGPVSQLGFSGGWGDDRSSGSSGGPLSGPPGVEARSGMRGGLGLGDSGPGGRASERDLDLGQSPWLSRGMSGGLGGVRAGATSTSTASASSTAAMSSATAASSWSFAGSGPSGGDLAGGGGYGAGLGLGGAGVPMSESSSAIAALLGVQFTGELSSSAGVHRGGGPSAGPTTGGLGMGASGPPGGVGGDARPGQSRMSFAQFGGGDATSAPGAHGLGYGAPLAGDSSFSGVPLSGLTGAARSGGGMGQPSWLSGVLAGQASGPPAVAHAAPTSHLSGSTPPRGYGGGLETSGTGTPPSEPRSPLLGSSPLWKGASGGAVTRDGAPAPGDWDSFALDAPGAPDTAAASLTRSGSGNAWGGPTPADDGLGGGPRGGSAAHASDMPAGILPGGGSLLQSLLAPDDDEPFAASGAAGASGRAPHQTKAGATPTSAAAPEPTTAAQRKHRKKNRDRGGKGNKDAGKGKSGVGSGGGGTVAASGGVSGPAAGSTGQVAAGGAAGEGGPKARGARQRARKNHRDRHRDAGAGAGAGAGASGSAAAAGDASTKGAAPSGGGDGGGGGSGGGGGGRKTRWNKKDKGGRGGGGGGGGGSSAASSTPAPKAPLSFAAAAAGASSSAPASRVAAYEREVQKHRSEAAQLEARLRQVKQAGSGGGGGGGGSSSGGATGAASGSAASSGTAAGAKGQQAGGNRRRHRNRRP